MTNMVAINPAISIIILNVNKFIYTSKTDGIGSKNTTGWGYGSSGSALAWHARGAGFNPQHEIKMLCPLKTKKQI